MYKFTPLIDCMMLHMCSINPFMPTVAFNICCSRDCVSRHNGGTAGAPLKPLRDDSALRALSSLRGLRGAPEVPPLCRETQSLGQQMLNATVGINRLIIIVSFFSFANYSQFYRIISMRVFKVLTSNVPFIFKVISVKVFSFKVS